MNTEAEILEFIKTKENTGALLLKGQWGCGKSYLIKSVAEKLQQKGKRESQKKSDAKSMIEVQETSISKNEKEKEPFLNPTISTKNSSVLNEDEDIRNHVISNENEQEDNSKENDNLRLPNHSHLQKEITSNLSIELSQSIQTEQKGISASNEYENETVIHEGRSTVPVCGLCIIPPAGNCFCCNRRCRYSNICLHL